MLFFKIGGLCLFFSLFSRRNQYQSSMDDQEIDYVKSLPAWSLILKVWYKRKKVHEKEAKDKRENSVFRGMLYLNRVRKFPRG